MQPDSSPPPAPSPTTTRLADLNPTLKAGFLTFDCPYPGHTHRLRVPVSADHGSYRPGAFVWFMTGTFPDSLTLSPSVNANTESPCWHGHIANGDVQ